MVALANHDTDANTHSPVIGVLVFVGTEDAITCARHGINTESPICIMQQLAIDFTLDSEERLLVGYTLVKYALDIAKTYNIPLIAYPCDEAPGRDFLDLHDIFQPGESSGFIEDTSGKVHGLPKTMSAKTEDAEADLIRPDRPDIATLKRLRHFKF